MLKSNVKNHLSIEFITKAKPQKVVLYDIVTFLLMMTAGVPRTEHYHTFRAGFDL